MRPLGSHERCHAGPSIGAAHSAAHTSERTSPTSLCSGPCQRQQKRFSAKGGQTTGGRRLVQGLCILHPKVMWGIHSVRCATLPELTFQLYEGVTYCAAEWRLSCYQCLPWDRMSSGAMQAVAVMRRSVSASRKHRELAA